MTRTFEVDFSLFIDAETGEEYILPTESDLDKEEKKAKDVLKSVDVNTKGMDKDEKIRIMAKKELAESILLGIAEQRDARIKLAPYSEKHNYTLRKPTYGEYLEAENKAKDVKDDGSIYIDNAALGRELLPNSVNGMKPKEVLELPPIIYLYLWNRLYASIWPDPAKLPFLSSLVKTT